MSDKEASLKENVLSFANLLCIKKKMLRWLLSVALLTGYVMSLLLSAVHVFSFIPSFFVSFFKKNFISSATTL